LCLASAEVPLHRALTADDRVEGEYILSFLRGVNKADLVEFFSDNVKMGVELKTLRIHDWQAAIVTLTPEQLEYHLQQDHILEFVSENRIYNIAQNCDFQSNVPSWGLERCSEEYLDLSSNEDYWYPAQSGQGVTAYIIDTGVYCAHSDFTGRCEWGTNTIDGNNSDCHGHGTHVAGTVGGTQYGIAKGVRIIAVKVLNCGGGGTSASVIQGIQWVTTNRAPGHCVANMSLGGGNDAAMINAVAASSAAGITHVVAAGNSNANACNYSPANAPAAISCVSTTVEPAPGGEVQEDVRSSFSNYGTCTHVCAPGTLINSAWIGSPTDSRLLSGTSMASPHVAGAVALLMGSNECASPASCKQAVIDHASNGIVDLACTNAVCNQTPNRLLHTGRLCPNVV